MKLVDGALALFESAKRSIRRQPSAEEVAELSTKYIVAAGDNDVREMKRLEGLGADINFKADVVFDSGTLIFSNSGISQPEGKATALMAALHNGAYDAALHLAQSGADGTFARIDNAGSSPQEEKALDFLVTDYVRERTRPTPTTRGQMDEFMADVFDEQASAQRKRDYRTDLFTPEQRVRIFDELVVHTAKPLDLLSEQTRENVIIWARAEMVPKLAAIGVKFGDEDFVTAANPYPRPDRAVPIMAALLPYVKDVNVTGRSDENAGHAAAGKADLEAFKWLEARGLKKDAMAKFNVPTYAHLVAGLHSHRDEAETAKRAEFAEHLVAGNYPLDVRDPDYNKQTPTDVAFTEGNHPTGLVYLDAGVPFRPENLTDAIGSRHYNTISTPALLDLIDEFGTRGFLTQDVLRAGFNRIVEDVNLNEKNAVTLAPVLKSLLQKGLELQEGDAPFAKKLLERQTGPFMLPAAKHG